MLFRRGLPLPEMSGHARKWESSAVASTASGHWAATNSQASRVDYWRRMPRAIAGSYSSQAWHTWEAARRRQSRDDVGHWRVDAFLRCRGVGEPPVDAGKP
jgi:hypothetical protein